MELTEPTGHITQGAFRPLRLVLFAAALVAGAALLSISVSAHLERACTTMDTPYLPLCPAQSKDPDELLSQVRDRLRANPGDATAWARLLALTPPAEGDGVLSAAAEVAPNHPNVLRRRAAAALAQNRLPEAVSLLIQMLRSRGTAEAGQVLAQIIGSGQGSLLRPHLDSAERWLPPVITHYMPTQKIPPGPAVPLVAEAVEKGTLSDRSLRNFIQILKASGQWHDAYGLWLVRHKGSVPLLYNGSFDRPVEPGGFDWEFQQGNRARAGALVEQGGFAKRGKVLEVDFNGKAFSSPIVQQYLLVPPDTYRLQGEFRSTRLKTEGGVVWKVVCPMSGNSVVGESAALKDTGGAWKKFELVFTVPARCGPVASLQLEPAAAFEAGAGMRGEFAFDAFSLGAADARSPSK